MVQAPAGVLRAATVPPVLAFPPLPAEVIDKVLTGVVDYTVYHFDTEEKLLRQYGYQEEAAHRAEHAKLAEQVQTLTNGTVKVEMYFLPDIYVPCEVCKGARYNRETLEILYKGRSIHQVLEMTVTEGHEFFAAVPVVKLTEPIVRTYVPPRPAAHTTRSPATASARNSAFVPPVA